MNKKKKIIMIFSIIAIILLILCIVLLLVNKSSTNEEINKLEKLPKPEISSGARGELGIDKNINETTIDKYLNRNDSVYRDMRMLEDPGKYEAIGGDRFLSGYIKGFEVISLPYIIPVTGLPSEVGDTYTGTTLFYNDNGTYVANYKESMSIIEKIFPKDKVIFLMCGGGGYAGMTKDFLVSLGWDENKIYNVGGYWYYKGKNSVNIKKEVNGVVSYDFDSVPYHNIEFDKLTKSDKYKAPTVKVTEIKISTSKIELEEGTSFKLNAIVLPNEATNKEVKWTSSNESIATVTNDGLVKAISAGNATITVKSVDGDKSVLCTVTVNKKKVSTHIKLDDISKEAQEFASYDLEKIYNEFKNNVYDSNGNLKKEYHEDSNEYMPNDLYREELRKNEERTNTARNKRSEIFNKIIDNKKSFIILVHSKECDENKDSYSILSGAQKILKQNNYSYLDVGSTPYDGDEVLERSKFKIEGTKPVIIINNGEIYATVDKNVNSIKNDEEMKNWLNKYIDIK